jgi:hypothetical protein
MPHDSVRKERRGLHPALLAENSGGLLRTTTPTLNQSVQKQIGQRLRHVYDALAIGEQPVPDRLIEIIDRLAKARPEDRS